MLHVIVAGVDDKRGTISLHQGSNEEGQIEYWGHEASRIYGSATLSDALALTPLTGEPTDEVGKAAISFRLRVADTVAFS